MHPDRQAYALNDTRGDRDSNGSTRGRGGRGGSSSSTRGASSASQGFPGAIPSGSISKLKAQMRQTKRLLSRDDLTPDVRTTSERRVKTLELELQKAEQSALEVKMVTRYRGVRFFERQKLLRKIKQAKKALESSPSSSAHSAALLDARVDLYYVLRYPKTQKYIALFPSGSYIPFLPAPPADTPPSDALAKRHALRSSIRRKLEAGELPAEPESGELGIEGEEDVPVAESSVAGEKRAREEDEEPSHSTSKAKKSKPATAVAPPTIVSASKPAPAAPAPAPATATTKEREGGVRQTKKEKKDLKDAKRRAAKILKESTTAVVGDGEEKVEGGAVEKEGEAGEGEGEGKEGWAGEDEFFA